MCNVNHVRNLGQIRVSDCLQKLENPVPATFLLNRQGAPLKSLAATTLSELSLLGTSDDFVIELVLLCIGAVGCAPR